MPSALAGLRIGQRELTIARAIARYRFLSTPQIAQIDGGSQQHLSRRLRLMVQHKVLALPTAQYVARIVTQPRIFALARGGAKLLAATDGLPIDHLDWATKNARATGLFIAHTLETADTMLAFNIAAQTFGLRLLDHGDLFAFFPEATVRDRNPFALRATIKAKTRAHELSLVPDRLFSLVTAESARYNFALELDRGTMPVTRSTLIGKSSFARKLAIYWNAWTNEEHVRRWGFRQFRVLTVAPSEQRIASMIGAAKDIAGRSTGLFLFTTPELVRNEGPLARIWLNLKGERVALLP